MSDHRGSCEYDPRGRLDDRVCPFTAGYWTFLDRNDRRLAGNHRMAQPLRGLCGLDDLDAVVEQERHGTDF
jgi:(6-4)DNA photolyase